MIFRGVQMDDPDEAEEAIAYIRQSTANPIRRFLDVVVEHRLEDPSTSERGSRPAARKGERRAGAHARWRQRFKSVVRLIAMRR
jgi:hypothetical protein